VNKAELIALNDQGDAWGDAKEKADYHTWARMSERDFFNLGYQACLENLQDGTLDAHLEALGWVKK
jgi:hypothetical protein